MGVKLQDFLIILKQIDKIDIYGQQISLKFKKQSEFKTRFGGLITIIVGLLTGMWTIVTVYQLIYSTVVSIIPQQIPLGSQEIKTISLAPEERGVFQIGLFDQVTQQHIKLSQFEILSYYYQECDLAQQIVEVKQSKNQDENKILLSDCSQLQQTEDDYKFLENDKSGYFCFEKQQISQKQEYPFISQSSNCQNSIHMLVVKKQNLSIEQISQLYENSFISLAIPTNLIDYQDVYNPFDRTTQMRKFYIQNDQSSSSQSPSKKVMISINFEQIVIDNQRNLSLQESSSTQSFIVESISEQMINQALNAEEEIMFKNNIKEEDILFKVKLGFTKKNYYTKYNRYFQSIPTILGVLGGGIKIVVLMGFLIVSPLTKIHFQKTMLNEVFNFENGFDEQEQEQQNQQQKPLNPFSQPTLKSIDGQQSVNKGNNSQFHNSNLNNSDNINDPPFSPQKQVNSKTHMKVLLNQENQLISKSQQLNPMKNKLLQTSSAITPANNFMAMSEHQPLSMMNIYNNKIFHNIERERSPLSVKNSRTPNKSKSIVPSQKVIPNQDNNHEEINLTQISLLKGVHNGEKKNKLKEIIKETILINSQRGLGESQHFIEQHSPTPIPKVNKRSSFQSNQISNHQLQIIKKKQKDQKKAEDQIFEKHFRTTFNPLKISFLQSFFYYIWPFGRFKRTKEQISYSVEKLNYHLDSIYIIKKLLEIDKLKMLLLDENQIKLLEFLPKPTINLNKIKPENFDASNISSIKSNDGQQNINILYQDTRNELTKATQAFQAFQSIKSKNILTQIDRKLIDLLDPKIADYFNLDQGKIPKSQTIQINQSSIESDVLRNQGLNTDKNQMNRQHFQNGIAENSVTYSQNMLKDKYLTASLGNNMSNNNNNNQPYISSPLEIYRTTTKKASMFKQSTKHKQRCSISVTQQSQKYDEIEEEQNNSVLKSKKSFDVKNEESSNNKLTRIRSISNDLPQNINKKISKDSSYNNMVNKSGGSSKPLSLKKYFSNQKSKGIDDIDSHRNRVESVYEQDGVRISHILQYEKDRIKEQKHDRSQVGHTESEVSIYSNGSQNMIADESIQLQSLDYRKIQQFTIQNKFSTSITPNNKQANKSKPIQSQRNFSTAINSTVQSRKLSIEEENKLASQKDIQFILSNQQIILKNEE